MNSRIDRLPAIPLITNDPFFSIWMPADKLTDDTASHWTGVPKPLLGFLVIDGREYRWLCRTGRPAMETKSLEVTPTRTVSVFEAAGVQLKATFCSPALPDDLDVLSTPITYVDLEVKSLDGREHETTVYFRASSELCYDGQVSPELMCDSYVREGLQMGYVGQLRQNILSQSGDHITIDWGYLYMASKEGVTADTGAGLTFRQTVKCTEEAQTMSVMVGYDEIASILYYGTACRAWGLRSGKTMPEALCEFAARHDEILAACEKLDAAVKQEAREIGGDDYELIACAAWRHTFCAHKLIATPAGEMALLSKENDSNGCIGTVDVSYPSVPLFLRFCPELVNALCRPVLEFANMPVWEFDFAPHDVGRYPHAIGQVYAAKRRTRNGYAHPAYYQYPAGCDIYDFTRQMPVEECGNMLIMLEAAVSFGADDSLLKKYTATLETWVKYLDKYGEDPGEQLCTDDFAGHLARNINLSAKAVVGTACFSRIMDRLGETEKAGYWKKRAAEMADSWLKRASAGDHTALTFDGNGWSMKYNLVWDIVLGLDLLPADFYRQELASYLPRINEFGLPLDSRDTYTKSDWELWVATMADDAETFHAIIAPIAHYLRTSTSRVPFSDWYDTVNGRLVHFIARSVQGGLYMPMLTKKRFG